MMLFSFISIDIFFPVKSRLVLGILIQLLLRLFVVRKLEIEKADLSNLVVLEISKGGYIIFKSSLKAHLIYQGVIVIIVISIILDKVI